MRLYKCSDGHKILLVRGFAWETIFSLRCGLAACQADAQMPSVRRSQATGQAVTGEMGRDSLRNRLDITQEIRFVWRNLPSKAFVIGGHTAILILHWSLATDLPLGFVDSSFGGYNAFLWLFVYTVNGPYAGNARWPVESEGLHKG